MSEKGFYKSSPSDLTALLFHEKIQHRITLMLSYWSSPTKQTTIRKKWWVYYLSSVLFPYTRTLAPFSSNAKVAKGASIPFITVESTPIKLQFKSYDHLHFCSLSLRFIVFGFENWFLLCIVFRIWVYWFFIHSL